MLSPGLRREGEIEMRVGIMSDSHDNLPLIARALDVFRRRDVRAILHAGDFIAPFAVKALRRFDGPIHAVFGNNDGEKTGIRQVLPDIQDPPSFFSLADRTFCMVHDIAAVDDVGALDVDVLVYGHDHRGEVRPGRPLVINPGETGGWLYGSPQVAVLDTDAMCVESVPLDG